MTLQGPEPPDSDAFRAIANSPDPMRLFIDGQKALDAALTALLLEQLDEPDVPGIRRLQFGTKVDLLIGMGLLPRDSRPTWAAFNRLRNRFAHESDIGLDDSSAGQLVDALSEHHRHMLSRAEYSEFEGPSHAASRVFAVLFVEATEALKHLRDSKVASAALRGMVRDVVGDAAPMKSWRDEVIDQQVNAAREARRQSGRW